MEEAQELDVFSVKILPLEPIVIFVGECIFKIWEPV